VLDKKQKIASTAEKIFSLILLSATTWVLRRNTSNSPIYAEPKFTLYEFSTTWLAAPDGKALLAVTLRVAAARSSSRQDVGLFLLFRIVILDCS
jgi:hypothetical protein